MSAAATICTVGYAADRSTTFGTAIVTTPNTTVIMIAWTVSSSVVARRALVDFDKVLDELFGHAVGVIVHYWCTSDY